MHPCEMVSNLIFKKMKNHNLPLKSKNILEGFYPNLCDTFDPILEFEDKLDIKLRGNQ